jgi:hypothetical protein
MAGVPHRTTLLPEGAGDDELFSRLDSKTWVQLRDCAVIAITAFGERGDRADGEALAAIDAILDAE